MKKLLLTSQGIPPELKDVFLSLLDKPADQIKVAFIVTAAYGEEPNPKWLEVYRKQLRDCGINLIEDLDIKGKNQTVLEAVVSDKDILFVNGGSPFYLLKWVKKSEFDKVVKKFIAKGKFYVGISAGSYIACPTIEQGLWKRDRNIHGLNNFAAMNLLPFIIFAHFEEKYRLTIEQAARSCQYPIIALNDTQAILVKGNKYKLVGKGNKNFFNGFKEKI